MHRWQGFTLTKQTYIAYDHTGMTYIPTAIAEVFIQINHNISHSTDRMRNNDTDADRHNTGKTMINKTIQAYDHRPTFKQLAAMELMLSNTKQNTIRPTTTAGVNSFDPLQI